MLCVLGLPCDAVGWSVTMEFLVCQQYKTACADPKSFVRGGPTLITFFYEGREDPRTTISGPSSAHEMAFRWRADDRPTLNAGLVAAIFQGIRTCIARK